MSEDNIYRAPESNLGVENIEELIYAGFWIRVVASLIDTVLILLLTWPILTLIYGKAYWLSESFIQGTWDFVFSYIIPAVIVILFWIYKSATPGKMILGLRVISLGENRALSVGQSIGRYCGYYVSMIPLLIGIIWVAFDKRKQGWHDKLSNTAVVKIK